MTKKAPEPPKEPTQSAHEKLDHFRDLIASGDVPDAKVAELAGVEVSDVEAYVDAMTTAPTPQPEDVPVAADADADADGFSREAVLQNWEEELKRRELALVAAAASLAQRHSLPPPSDTLQIRVTSAFSAVGPGPNGKTVQHRFGPSLFRGNMARFVVDLAEQSNNLHLIEVISTQG